MARSTTPFLGTLRGRLIAGTSALALVPLLLLAVALGLFASQRSASTLEQRASEQLESIRTAKQGEIAAYFGGIGDLLRVLAGTTEVRDAVRDGVAARTTLPAGVDEAAARAALERYYAGEFARQYAARNPGGRIDAASLVATLPPSTVAAQYAYIAANPNPLGRKHVLDRGGGDAAAAEAHARIHAFARRAVSAYALYDLFLVDARSGDVVYSYFKELDFATNLRTGPWARTGLGTAFARAMAAPRGDAVVMTDYAPYRPSYDDQAAFVATPVTSGGVRVGVLIVQLPIDRVDAIMNFGNRWETAGLGRTGETYLVGPDRTPRSVARPMREARAAYLASLRARGVPKATIAAIAARGSDVGMLAVDTPGVRAALEGRSGTAVYRDAHGHIVLGAHAPVRLLGQSWGIVAEIEKAEADAPALALRRAILYAGLAALVLVGALALFAGLRLARSINAPLGRVHATVQKVAAGDLDARTGPAGSDEIGQLAGAFDRLLDEKVAELARAQRENERLNASVIDIMTSVAQLAQRDLNVKVPVSEDVTGAVSDAINMLTGATARALKEVDHISSRVADGSGRVRRRADVVHQLADEASQQANAASHELATTASALRQIGEQAQGAGREAERALGATGEALAVVRATVEGITASRDQIRETEKRVKRLAERSQEISSVVGIIGQIAERTSVLALNASMQAVAAGDAGRGFGVVADEVKRLAENAREATQQIAGLVGAIQADTAETLQAMNGTIAQVVDITRLADRAGAQMHDTRAATEGLVDAVRAISDTTQAQGEASQRLLNRAYELIGASQRTLDEIAHQRGDAEQLTESASALVRTVSEFRLPA